jgi:hypothetical protein
VFSLAPVLDNAMSLLSDVNNYPFNEEYNHMRGRLYCKPFYSDFDEQIRLFEDMCLVIDYNTFKSKLISKFVEFKQVVYLRALNVLDRRMKESKDKIWM